MVWILKSFISAEKTESTYQPKKNHQLFVKIANVLRKRDDFKFYIAGDGPEKESIMKEIEKYGLQQNVKMLGNISNHIDL